jgi:hypothetical protein
MELIIFVLLALGPVEQSTTVRADAVKRATFYVIDGDTIDPWQAHSARWLRRTGTR